jgi:hypothetical protein
MKKLRVLAAYECVCPSAWSALTYVNIRVDGARFWRITPTRPGSASICQNRCACALNNSTCPKALHANTWQLWHSRLLYSRHLVQFMQPGTCSRACQQNSVDLQQMYVPSMMRLCQCSRGGRLVRQWPLPQLTCSTWSTVLIEKLMDHQVVDNDRSSRGV